MGVEEIIYRLDDNGYVIISNMPKASPLTNPKDVKMVSFHFLEDLTCFCGLPHGLDIPCANFDITFWLKQTVSHTHGFQKWLSTWVIILPPGKLESAPIFSTGQ